MLHKQVVDELDLTNPGSFGLFNHEMFIPEGEWKQEIEERKIAFSSLPPFIDKVNNSVKKKMRNGIPPTYRRRIWFLASGGFDLYKETGNIYESALRNAKKRPITIDSNFGCCIDVLNFLPQSAGEKLRELLHVLWVNNPSITFAPLIPSVCAIMLLYLEPHLAYFSIQAMINRSYHDSWFFTHTRELFLGFVQAISDLALKHCPDVAKHANSLGLSLAEVCLTLFPTFFLPFSTLPVALTIFDSFVHEGRKILIRLCLGLFIEEKAILINSTTINEFYTVLISSIDNLSSPKKVQQLLKRSFKISLSREKHIVPIEKLAIKNKTGLLGDDFFNATDHLSFISPSSYSRRNSSESIGDSFSSQYFEFGNRMAFSLNLSVIEKGPIEASPSTFDFPEFEFNSSVLRSTVPTVVNGMILTDSIYYTLRQYLPRFYRHHSPVCVFRLSLHGTTFSSFLSHVPDNGYFLLIIKTTNGTFGSTMSDPPSFGKKGRYYGSASTFVFSVTDFKVYIAPENCNKCFISVTSDSMLIGGPKPALFIDDGFNYLRSDACETFNSPPFVSKPTGDKILDLEVYKLILRPVIAKE